MDFFVLSRDAPGTGALRDDRDLLEEHWSYMDGFRGDDGRARADAGS
ncbi:MAG TPA: hypothetical protein VHH55_06225 [Gaiellaceae bacterium]|nr:hypothetical protein [Gaiellaceae bacterium]